MDLETVIHTLEMAGFDAVELRTGHKHGVEPSLSAAELAGYTRGHWGVENVLHWRLDVSMNEDQCRLRVKHGAENFSRLRRIAINKLKRWEITKPNGKVMKTSLRIKQRSCGWSRKFLLEALLA